MNDEPRYLKLSTLLLAAAWALLPVVGNANPTGATVIAGSVQFDSSTANQLHVTNSPNAIINWNGFSIAANETTRFIQQSANSFVLNRVTGVDQSQILGQLQSNGRVLLINQNGVLFGAGSVIDTAGILASTLDVSDADFLAGNLQFSGSGGVITNESVLRVGSGGNVLLIASQITNRGTIDAPEGNIVLAAVKSVALCSWEDPTVVQSSRFEPPISVILRPDVGVRASQISLTSQVSFPPASGAVSTSNILFLRSGLGRIVNTGTIKALNGRIEVRASSAFESFGTINAGGGSISIDTPISTVLTLRPTYRSTYLRINPNSLSPAELALSIGDLDLFFRLTRDPAIKIGSDEIVRLESTNSLSSDGVENRANTRRQGLPKSVSEGSDSNPLGLNASISGGVLTAADQGGLILAAGKSLALSSWENPTVQFEIRAPSGAALNIAGNLVNGGIGKIFSGLVRHSQQIKITGLNRAQNGGIVISGSDR